MRKQLISIALTSALVSAPLHAEIQLSGFGSIVGGMTTSSDENLYGYNENFDFKEGSLFAIQATSDLENGLGVTVQLEAKGTDDWNPEFKWAYVSYDATDNVRLLAGRQRLPFYMYSDYLDVSYAYAWIEPPNGVYNVPFDTFDGLGAVYNTTMGSVDGSFHAVYGRNTDELNIFGNNTTLEVNDLAGLAATFTYEWLTLRAGYFAADVTIPIDDLDGLAALWDQAGFANIANNTRVEDDSASFLELGFQLNFDAIMFVGEYTELEIDNTPLASEESYYVMAGYQFEKVLVHLTYGMDEGITDNYTSGVPYGLHDDIDILKASTEGLINSQAEDANYITAGVRYDFHDSAALKFEYTTYSDELSSAGDAGLFRVAVVTVF